MGVNILWNSFILMNTKVVLSYLKPSVYYNLSYSIYIKIYSLATRVPKIAEDKKNISMHILRGKTYFDGGHRGRDRMVDGFPTTCAISAYHQ